MQQEVLFAQGMLFREFLNTIPVQPNGKAPHLARILKSAFSRNCNFLMYGLGSLDGS